MSEWALRLWELQVIRVTFIPANGAPVRPRNVYLDISSDTQPPRYRSQPPHAALLRTLVHRRVPSRPALRGLVGWTSACVFMSQYLWLMQHRPPCALTCKIEPQSCSRHALVLTLH